MIKNENQELTTTSFELRIVIHIPIGLLHCFLHQKLDLKSGAHPANLGVDSLILGLAIFEQFLNSFTLVSKIIVRRSLRRPAFFLELPGRPFEHFPLIFITVRERLLHVVLLRGLL